MASSGHPDPGRQTRPRPLAERHKLALVTLRRDWPSLMEHLLWLRLADPFSAVCNPGNSHRSISKADVIRMAAPRRERLLGWVERRRCGPLRHL